MWNSFIYKDDAYIIKTVIDKSINPAKYKVVLSDIVHAWTEELSDDQIVERCKTLNPLLSTSEEEYVNIVLSMIKDLNTQNELVILKNADGVTLDCKSYTEIIAFKFSFYLKSSNAQTFCKEFTVPMIQTIQLLENRQKIMSELIEKKDVEIQQHVFENGELKRENVKTQKFDITTMCPNTSDKLCFNVFTKSDEFRKVLFEKYGCPEATLLTVKKEEKISRKGRLSLVKSIIKRKRPNVSSSLKMK